MRTHSYVEENRSTEPPRVRECVICMPLLSTNKAVDSIFEAQRRQYQKFKTGESVAPQKELMSSIN